MFENGGVIALILAGVSLIGFLVIFRKLGLSNVATGLLWIVCWIVVPFLGSVFIYFWLILIQLLIYFFLNNTVSGKTVIILCGILTSILVVFLVRNANQKNLDYYPRAQESLVEGDYFQAYRYFQRFINSNPEHELVDDAQDEIEKLVPIIGAYSGDGYREIIDDFAEDFCKDPSMVLPGYIATSEHADGIWICGEGSNTADSPGDLAYIIFTEDSDSTTKGKSCGPYVNTETNSGNFMLTLRLESTQVSIYSLRENQVIRTQSFTAENECPLYAQSAGTNAVIPVSTSRIRKWVEHVLDLP